jgi:hypothetical protein
MAKWGHWAMYSAANGNPSQQLPLAKSDNSASSSTVKSNLNEQRVLSANSKVKHFPFSSLFQWTRLIVFPTRYSV